jgi:hypothetical protein
MNPPQNAVVLCMDEKTGIQALDRTQPMLPLRASKPRSWTNEYVRHGTLHGAGQCQYAQVRKRRTSKDFLAFMDWVVKEYPGQRLYVVLDNLNTHTNDAAKTWATSEGGEGESPLLKGARELRGRHLCQPTGL